MLRQAKHWGAPPHVIEALEQKEEQDNAFGVWPENWPTVVFFLTVQTQWRYGAMGGYLGLDYSAIDVMIRYRQMDVTPEMFEGMQLMERTAIPILNKK